MQVLLTTRSVNVLTGLRNPAQRLTGRRRIRFGRQITGTNDPAQPLVVVHDRQPVHLAVYRIP